MAEEPGFDFLGERWKKTAERERGKSEVLESPIFEEIERGAFGNPQLENLFKELKERILEYALSADRLSMRREERGYGESQNEDIVSADRTRRSAHEALIDQVNILSRAFLREGLPNKWREKVGDSREEIGEWGFAVAEYLRAKAKEADE